MAANDSQLIYRIAFALLRGMGVELAGKILDVLPDEKTFFDLSERELSEIAGRHHITERTYRNECLLKAEHELEFIERYGIQVLYFSDSNFPQRLLQGAADAPILLYCLGNGHFSSKHVVSIVGTRRATEYGRNFVDRLVHDLGEMLPDVVTVSGLAYGTDIAAHRASLKHGVPTIGVQACGLNKIYPASHRADASAIVEQGGAIVSDYTSQDPVHKGNFVARNRIIAALSDCTVVVESADKGGSLITANIAQSYNREVMALPGRTSDQFSQGCNHLIQRMQAHMIQNADDLLQVMNWESVKTNKPTTQLELFPKLSDEESKIVQLVQQKGDIYINTLTEQLDIPIYKVVSIVNTLCFRGILIYKPGGRYSLA